MADTVHWAELVSRAQLDDQIAANRLAEGLRAMLLQISGTSRDDIHTREDRIQETLIRVFRMLHRLKNPDRIPQYTRAVFRRMQVDRGGSVVYIRRHQTLTGALRSNRDLQGDCHLDVPDGALRPGYFQPLELDGLPAHQRENVRDPHLGPLDSLLQKESRSLVESSAPNGAARTALIGRVLDGRSYDDLSTMLGTSVAATRQLYCRALAKARPALEEYLAL